jgi:hypothetical protein
LGVTRCGRRPYWDDVLAASFESEAERPKCHDGECGSGDLGVLRGVPGMIQRGRFLLEQLAPFLERRRSREARHPLAVVSLRGGLNTVDLHGKADCARQQQKAKPNTRPTR